MTMEDKSATGARSKKEGGVPRRGSSEKKRHNSTSVSQDGTSGASMSEDKDKAKKRSSTKRSSTKGKKTRDKEKELKPQKSLDRSSSNQSSTSMEDSQIEMLTPKENGYVDDAEGGEFEEEKGKRNASIKGMWKKAFKSLKSNDKQNWLSKKGSLIRRKDSEEKEEQAQTSKEIDPVYSLLKCAADLPKVPKSQKEAQCSGGHLGGRGDSSGSTSKASSPSSSGQQFPMGPSQTCLHSISGGGVVGSPGRTGSASPQVYVGNGSTTNFAPFFGGNKSSRDREHMHHIVDESLGSEFRTFYKLTSPVKKTFIPSFESVTAKKAQGPNFEGVVKRQTSYDAV